MELQKTILYGDDLRALSLAADEARRWVKENGVPTGNWMGLRIDGKYYSVKFNKAGVTVAPSS